MANGNLLTCASLLLCAVSCFTAQALETAFSSPGNDIFYFSISWHDISRFVGLLKNHIFMHSNKGTKADPWVYDTSERWLREKRPIFDGMLHHEEGVPVSQELGSSYFGQLSRVKRVSPMLIYLHPHHTYAIWYGGWKCIYRAHFGLLYVRYATF
jgi:hypothetical protein